MSDYMGREAYENYDSNDELSPYELLMQMQSWNKAIYLRIENSEEQTQTQLAVLDGKIVQSVSDLDDELSTRIETTAAGIQASIVDLDEELSNQITTTAAGINATITDTKNGLQTQITANAQGLASKVSTSNYNGQTIASLITQTPAAITMIANSLNLSGYVTFSSLTATGTTNIDGARITTGLISADRIAANTVLAKLIQAGGISADYIQAGTLKGVSLQSANGYTAVNIENGRIGILDLNSNGGSAYIGPTIQLYTGGVSGWASLQSNQLQLNNGSGGSMTLTGTSLTANSTMYMYGTYNFGSATVTGLTASNASKAVEAQWLTGPTSTARYQPSNFAQTRTTGLGFGFSTASGLLYVSMNGTDVGTLQPA